MKNQTLRQIMIDLIKEDKAAFGVIFMCFLIQVYGLTEAIYKKDINTIWVCSALAAWLVFLFLWTIDSGLTRKLVQSTKDYQDSTGKLIQSYKDLLENRDDQLAIKDKIIALYDGRIKYLEKEFLPQNKYSESVLDKETSH